MAVEDLNNNKVFLAVNSGIFFGGLIYLNMLTLEP
jgi:hypothetical protein